MGTVAIVFSTQYGQTAKIAEVIGEEFRSADWLVEHIDLHTADHGLLDLGVDTVVIGGPVYAGKFHKELVEWVTRNLTFIRGKTIAFFSVSMNAADPRPAARKEDDRLIGEFLAKTGLKPQFVASLVGKLHYTKYNFFVRMVLKNASKKAGGPTDTSRDHELTDWKVVREFARAVISGSHDSRFAADHRLQPPKEPVLAS